MTVNTSTRVAAIIGNPVAQSLSPVIHNAVFNSLGINWLYMAFLVEADQVQNALDAMPRLGIAGYSVTMPHKSEVAKIVEKIGEVDDVVKITESANTVLLRDDDTIYATNTDGQGACNAIEMSGRQKIANSRAIVFGAGGTARAIVHSLIKNRAKEVVVFNRTLARAEKIARNYPNCRVGQDASLEMSQSQIVVNATPIGFDPTHASDAAETFSPVKARLFSSSHTVLDAVYRPLETAMLKAAKKSGAQVVDGLEMLVHQAALQQEVWFGRRGDIQLMRSAAISKLASEIA